MRWAASRAIAFVLLALAGEASAQQAPPGGAPQTSTRPRVYFPLPRVAVFTTLTYEREPGAEVCPDEPTFRLETAAHLGHDPFAPNPEGIWVGDVRVVVTRKPGGFAARYAWTGSRDVVQPAGRFEGPGHTRRDCHDVLTDLATSLQSSFVLLEIDYGAKLAPKKPAPASEQAPAPAPCPESRVSVWPDELPMEALPKPKLSPPPPPERWPIAIRAGAAVWPELVASGWGSLGFSADVGVRYRAFSAGVEMHGDPPLGSAPFPDGMTLSFARLSGAVLLCAHWGWFSGCGVGDAGRFLFPNHTQKLPASTFYGAAGVRAGLEFPVGSPRLFLRAALDLRAPIHPASYTVGTTVRFQAAGPGAGLGLGMLVELPP